MQTPNEDGEMETMNSVFDIRRANLRTLIDQWNGPKPLSVKLGYSNASFLVQMAGPNPTREVTERTARKIEDSLGLPQGWLDTPAGNQTEPAQVDMTLVSRVITSVAQMAQDERVTLSPAKLGDIVALVYSDAEIRSGAIRPDYIKSILQLLRE